MKNIFLIPIILILGSVISCSSSEFKVDPYKEDILHAFAKAESDYVREILSDGKITASEFRDSQSKNIACLSEAGVSASYVDQGYGYQNLEIKNSSSATFLAEDKCWLKWVGEIENIYINQIINPQNTDFEALIAACLVRENLVAKGFSGSDYRELISQNGRFISIDDSTAESPIEITLEPTGEIFLPSGIPLSNPRANMCTKNPSR